MDTTIIMDNTTYKAGQAPWETNQTSSTSFAAGKAPWEVSNLPSDSTPFKFNLPTAPETEQQKIARYQQNFTEKKAISDNASSPLTILKDTFSPFASSETGLGKTVSAIDANLSPEISGSMQDTLQQESDQQVRILKAIKDAEANGIDSTKYKRMYNDSVDRQQLNQKLLDTTTALPSTGETLGQLGGTALDVLTAGTYGKVVKAMEPFELAIGSKLLPTIAEKGAELLKNPRGIFSLEGLKAILKGGGVGYGYDVTQGAQGNRGEDRTGAAAFIPGLMTLVGAGAPAVVEAGGTVRNLFSAPKYLEDLKTDWNKVGGDFVKSNKILNKAELRGKDPVNILSERGITPQSMVDGQSGLFSTTETANRIRTVDTAPFEDVLQKSLQKADRGATPIPVSEIEQKALDSVKNDTTLTLGQKKALSQKISDESALLQSEYKGGISRVDSNVEKRKFWQNTKFDRANPIERDFFYQMGKAFKETIEKYTPDVNIQGLNSYLGDLYESAKFLDTLNGKKPKISIQQKISRALTKAAVTFVGAHLGGGLPGGAAGYIVSNSVSHALESMSNPLKAYFLRNLETHSEAYDQAIKYLGQKEADRLKTLKLPSGTTNGVPNIINVGPKTDESGVKLVPAQKTSLPTVNPKTGRVQTTYTSESQDLNGGKNSNSKQTTNIPTNNNIPSIIPKNKGAVNAAVTAAIGGGTAVGAGINALDNSTKGKNETTYNSGYQTPSPIQLGIPPKTLINTLMQLESSGGTNHANEKKGEYGWLTGFTQSAVDELKRAGLISKIDMTNKQEVLNASVAYFTYLQSKYPDLTPAEVYTQHYWTQGSNPKQIADKASLFNQLIKK